MLILRPSNGAALKDYALMYVGMGWAVFPVWNVIRAEGDEPRCACALGVECSRPGKHPIGDLVPAGSSDASNSRAKVEAWWGAFPEASIGVATGAVSGLTVIDADAAEGKPGVLNLTRLCGSRGGVPQTFIAATGGGGLHLYFKHNAELRTGVNVLDEAIDVRSDGGYVIAPPSNHMLGDYAWRAEEAELLELPEWMLNAPREAASSAGGARRRGRPRANAAVPLDKVEAMLKHVDAEDRDRWLKMGLLLGRMFVGSPAESEAWSLYEAWASRSSKFDEDRSGNVGRMREQFYEYSQQEPRTGQAPLGVGTLVQWAREGGWTPFGDRVVVTYEAGNEAEMCSALVEALTGDPEQNRFYSIMGEVRDVLRAKLTSVRALKRAATTGVNPPDSIIVRQTTTPGLQCALSERVVLAQVSAKTGMQIAKPIPSDMAAMILKDRSNDFPPLAGIAEWPMVMDGEVINRRHGYDAETGLFFDIDPSVEIDLTLDPRAGWDWVREEFFADFPFEDDLAAAGALGMLLSMMQRPLMKTCPAFAIVAPQPGTGKSTLIEVSALAVHGVPIATHPFSNDEEELRKALHSLLVAKAAAVMFDNITRGLAVTSDHLAKLITSEAAADRILGSSETKREINTLLVMFTGNNIAFVRDLASRVVTIRMNAKSVDPLGRRFRHPDVRAWAIEHRNKVLSTLVAIARANPGRPAHGSPSRFEDYEEMVVGAVLNVTGKDLREMNVVVDVDADEDAATRSVLESIHQWQITWRGEGAVNGSAWRAAELVAAIESRAFPDPTIAAIRRFAGSNPRTWEADPVRVLAYALRGIKGDYKFHPYLLTSETQRDGVRWTVKSSAPPAEGVAEAGGGF